MDFRSRSAPAPAHPTPSGGGFPNLQNNDGDDQHPLVKWLQRSAVVLLFAITIILIAIAVLLSIGGNNAADSIRKDKYQSVFLNNNQVYFGKITGISDNNLVLEDIYYLQTGSTASEEDEAETSNISLIKLGCELHAPYDQMVINNDQILFWENLQDGGQVVKNIQQQKKDNPKGTCPTGGSNSTQQAAPTSTPSANTQQSQGSSTPAAGNSDTGTTAPKTP